MCFKNEKFHMEAEDHHSKWDTDLSSQVVLQSTHCADIKLFFFLSSLYCFVIPVSVVLAAMEPASQIMVVVQGEWFWK